MKKLVLLAASFIVTVFSNATVREVPSTYPTIQSALNSCQPFDTVLVTQGIYNENILWPAGVNGIKLLSAGTSNTTIISGNNTGKVISISSSNVDTNTVIKGFSITGGYISSGSGYGAGIYLNNAGIVMDDLVIDGNKVFVPGGHAYGAGVHMSNSTSVIRNCYINNNSTDSATWCYGGGIYISGGNITITDTEISGNSLHAENWCYGVGLYATNNAVLTLDRVRVESNTSGNDAIWFYGSGIYVDDVNCSMTNVLVTSNKSGSGGSFNYGGGIYFDGSLTVAQLTNVTVAGNTKTGNATINGSGVYARDASVIISNSILYNPNTGAETNTGGTGNFQITYSNVRNGFAGTGNINQNPAFVSPFDFHLTAQSACAGAGTLTGAPVIDIESTPRPLPATTMPDMGCYEVDQSLTTIEEWNHVVEKITIYPNPSVAGQQVHVSGLTSTSYKLLDVNGKICTILQPESGGADASIHTGDLKPGMYVLMNENHVTGRMVILH